MSDPARRIIVVLGCQRSGTTLVSQLLGAHPETVLVDELDGLYAWFSAAAERNGDLFEADEVFLRAARKYRVPAERFAPTSQGLAPGPRIRALVLQAPNLTFDDELLAGLTTPVVVVYPVRDPRAVVASMARLPEVDFVVNQRRLIDARPWIVAAHPHEHAVLDDSGASAWQQRTAVWRIKSGRAAAFRDRGLAVHQFRYEDLVSDGAAQIVRDLEAAAGLNCGQHAPPAAETFLGSGPGGTERRRAVDARSLERWRSDLSPEIAAEVMAAAAPLAGRWGYV